MQFIRKFFQRRIYFSLPFVPVWEAQGQTQSHTEPPALLLGSIPHLSHLGFITLLIEKASDSPAALTVTWWAALVGVSEP